MWSNARQYSAPGRAGPATCEIGQLSSDRY
jgi:hypothetical protein